MLYRIVVLSLLILLIAGVAQTSLAQESQEPVRKALVKSATGEVTNIILITTDSSWALPAGYELMDADSVSVGDIWDGEQFITPPKEVPAFPTSTHWATVKAFNPGALKPLTVERTWSGYDYTFDCYVSTELVDLYLAGKLVVGDYVLVDFVEHDTDKCLGTLKVYKTW